MKTRHLLHNILITLVMSLSLFSSFSHSTETVTLQLKWKHQFQFAGYYAAREKGFYQKAGLDVVIKEARQGVDPVEEVTSGNAEYGVGTSELILNHANGDPVVVLAVIFQHSPLGIAVSKNSELTTLLDIANSPIMIELNSAELLAYLKLEGLDKSALNIINHTFNTDDLVSGKVKAMSVYVTDEPFILNQKRHQYILFEPRLGGIDFYGDNLFTTKNEIKSHPERVEAFRQATLKGWRYAMENPEEIIQLIYQRYSQRHSIDHLRFEASQMRRLMQPELVEPGYMHQGRWKHIIKTYQSQGLLDMTYQLDNFIYSPVSEIDLDEYRPWFASAIVFIICLIFLGIFVYSLFRKLLAEEVKLQSIVDNSPSALIVSDNNGIIKSWNHQAEIIFGWQSSEVIGASAYSLLLPPEKIAEVKNFVESSFNDKRPTTTRQWNLNKNNERILCEWKNILVNDKTSSETYIISTAVDITKQKLLEEKLKVRAYTDPLTGLNNRSVFYLKLNHALKQAKRNNNKLGLLFIDLDKFKDINDGYGHESGDIVLKSIAERLIKVCRDSDVIARIGGDEFVVLLYDVNGRDAVQNISIKVLSELIQPIELDDHNTIVINSSIGASIYPEHGKQAEVLLKTADLAMYKVKQGSQKNPYIPPAEA
ncbi:diguanylate cyclase domain-containing protein [Aliikangiella sp. G2MR2-5]|uniref:diguanylate cyclase domain-containing protein n=1 Tax=Aliikangiella sp. G2MR2-5 TaxID=2788943 RepID=UPI0018ABAF6D